jgi:hypothetical protein
VKKFTFINFITIVMTIVFVGCQSEDNSLKMDKELTKVSISESIGFGQINPEFFEEYDEEVAIKTFRSIFSSAVKEPGEVNISVPEFDVNVEFVDGSTQGFHLWLGEIGQKSTLMKIESTSITYTLSEKMTNTLIELVLTEK